MPARLAHAMTSSLDALVGAVAAPDGWVVAERPTA